MKVNMKTLQTVRPVSRHMQAAKAAVFTVVALGTAAANAAIDAAVTTELAAAKTDVLTIGGIVFGIAVAIVLYKWFKRAL